MYFGQTSLTFQREELPQSSVSKSKVNKRKARSMQRTERNNLRQNKSSFTTDQSVDSPWNRTSSEVKDEVLVGHLHFCLYGLPL